MAATQGHAAATSYTLGTLIKASLPSIAMTLYSSISVVVDGLFVSNVAGTTALAGVNIGWPPVMVIGAVGYMLGTGGSALVAKTRGEGDEKRANAIFSSITWFCVLAGFVLTVVGLVVIEPLAKAIGAEGDLLHECLGYAIPLILVMPCFLLQYYFQSLSVTAGKPTIALYAMLGAATVNMVFDALFIAGFGWGARGAGVATAMSFLVGGLVPLIYFARKNPSYLKVSKPTLSLAESARAIARSSANGASEMVGQVTIGLVGMLYSYQFMKFTGEAGVAAFAVVMYVSTIFNALFTGFILGTSPLMSFEYGAKNRVAQHQIFKNCLLFFLVVGISLTTISELAARPLTWLFLSATPELVDATILGFRLYSISYIPMGFCLYAAALFTSVENGLVSAIIAFLRTAVFELAAVLILPALFGIDAIWVAMACADTATILVASCFVAACGKRGGFITRRHART